MPDFMLKGKDHMNNPYIGRAEKEVREILEQIYPNKLILPQFPIQKLIPTAWYNGLNEETKKHKFDFVVCDRSWLVIEVNYRHGEKAAKKWKNIFVPLIRDLKEPTCIPVTIDDYNCRTLFKHTKNSDRRIQKTDYQDVLDNLKLSGVSVNFTIPECN